MIRVKIDASEREVLFYFEESILALKILNDNLVGLGHTVFPSNRNYFSVLGDNERVPLIYKESLQNNYSLFLILMKGALKYFKKNYPERLQQVKENMEILSNSILN